MIELDWSLRLSVRAVPDGGGGGRAAVVLQVEEVAVRRGRSAPLDHVATGAFAVTARQRHRQQVRDVSPWALTGPYRAIDVRSRAVSTMEPVRTVRGSIAAGRPVRPGDGRDREAGRGRSARCKSRPDRGDNGAPTPRHYARGTKGTTAYPGPQTIRAASVGIETCIGEARRAARCYTCWPPLMWISAPFTYELVSVHST